jgi:hypothetical protein
MYRPNFAWRVVAPYPTHAGAAAMPECGWWRKREYSNVRDRERVLLILNGSTSLSFVCVIGRFDFSKGFLMHPLYLQPLQLVYQSDNFDR